MSISFETAVATLTSMFPDWDEETLSTLLISNNYHVERTIETVLAMSGDVSVELPATPQPTPAPMPTPMPTPAPTMMSSPTHIPPASSVPPHHHQPHQRAEEFRQRHPPRPQQRRPSTGNGRGVVPPPQQRIGYRGNHCELPETFLRAPGGFSAGANRNFTDEELALMLQNEMFQREVRQHLGDDFANNIHGQRYSVGEQQQPRGPPNTRRDPRVAGAAASTSGTGPTGIGSPNNVAAGAGADSGDLGIVKSLSSMGSAARRNLVQLAQRFSQSNPSTTGQQTHHRTGELGTSNEFKPLVDGNDDDDEEETEVISFDSGAANRSRHVLQDDPRIAVKFKADSQEEEFGSSNPLIQHK